MIEFPSNLVPLVDSFTETVESVVDRSEFEAGPARQRARGCGQYINYAVTYSVCGCDGMESFRDWFCNDACNGARAFLWTNPCTGETVKGRIADGVYAAAPDNRNLQSFNVTLNIEVWKPRA